MSAVWTYITDHGLRALCATCATVGDHGLGELQDYRGSEHKGICAGANHQDGQRRARKFTPDNVCSKRQINRGLQPGVAAAILAGSESE